MNAKTQGLLHVLVTITGVSVSFAFLPSPWNIVAGAVWSGIGAVAAFLNQSLSN